MTEVLLKLVNELGEGEINVGSSNIRNLAVLANNADCYEEMRLFIEYKIAKGNGWNDKFKENSVFGHEVLRCLDKIYEMCNKNDREALKNISKFFGYLYWKVCAKEKGVNLDMKWKKN